MSMIVCDKCQFEWLAKDTVFEEQMLDEVSGTKMRYFQCPECGAEYIIDVTDRELRRLLSVLKKAKKKYVRMYNEGASEIRLANYLAKLENIEIEIKERHYVLRRAWIRGE